MVGGGLSLINVKQHLGLSFEQGASWGLEGGPYQLWKKINLSKFITNKLNIFPALISLKTNKLSLSSGSLYNCSILVSHPPMVSHLLMVASISFSHSFLRFSSGSLLVWLYGLFS